MTIDDAIRHCEDVIKKNGKPILGCRDDYYNCHKCAEEHRQLAEWLKELKALKAQNLQPTCNQLATDTVSRQAVLDAFGLSEKTRKFGGDHSGYDTRMLYEIQDVIEGVPSAEPEVLACGHGELIAEPERKTGHWIFWEDDPDANTYECSECGEPYMLEEGTPKDNKYYFCPCCGSPMEVKHETD